jgi:hypothetical protein
MASKPVYKLSAEWRERIRSGVILDRLQQHAIGQLEMTPTQIRAAEILLRKVIPDLQAVQHSGEVTHSVRAVELQDDQLAAIAAGSRSGTAEAAPGPQEPARIH